MLSILLVVPALAQQALPRADIARLEHIAADPAPIDDAALVAFVREPFDPMRERAGGVSKDIRLPRGIRVGSRRYCIPAATEPYQG